MSNKNKGCQYILKDGANQGEKCNKSSLYNTSYCVEHENELEEEYKKSVISQRKITRFDFDSDFDANPSFKNEKDIVKFVDELLISYLFLYSKVSDRDRQYFCLYKEQFTNFTLDEVRKELELRGFMVYESFRTEERTYITIDTSNIT